MKKQIVTFALAGVLALGIVGCGQQKPVETSSQTQETPKVEQVELQTKWIAATNASEAAKGAGLDVFGAFDTIEFNDTVYKYPQFAYADGVAQATYDAGAHMLVLRKGANGHKAPLTDRDKTEFANKWAETYDGVDVSLYGPYKGAAIVLTWSNDGADYGVTYQGTGGEEVTLDSEDVAAIVSAVKEANAGQKTEGKAGAQKTDEKKSSVAQEQSQSVDAANSASSTTGSTAGSANSGTESGASSDSNEYPEGMAPKYSKDECIKAAYAYAGAGGQAKGDAQNTSVNGPIVGGGTTYYVVEFNLGDVRYTVQVDAIDGNVIGGEQTFNGMQQLLDDNGDPIPNTEQEVD